MKNITVEVMAVLLTMVLTLLMLASFDRYRDKLDFSKSYKCTVFVNSYKIGKDVCYER